jgi:ferric-dicitrate binding protein FerR (iron transport regulator)
MAGLSSTDLKPIAPVPGHEYAAGACNIGPWEIRRRRAFAIAAFAAAAVLFGVLVVVGAPQWARLLVLLPLWGGFFSWLQARRRFCAAYAMRGTSNFGDTHATMQAVSDAAARKADIAAVRRMTRDSLLLALPVTALLVLLPV